LKRIGGRFKVSPGFVYQRTYLLNSIAKLGEKTELPKLFGENRQNFMEKDEKPPKNKNF
jgi:hypothetical protein